MSLSWDPNTEPQLAGYWLYYGRATGDYTQIIDVGKVTSTPIPSLSPGNWYFAVRAYGQNGEVSGFSNEVMVAVPDYPNSGSPAIEAVTVSNITGHEATVSWITDMPADSEVEFWSASGNTGKAALRDLTQMHSLDLNHLEKSTTYHVLVKSAASATAQSVGPETVFTTPDTFVPELALPRPEAADNALGAGVLTGFALVNLGDSAATVTVKGMEADGNPTTGPGISNPWVLQLPPHAQVPAIDRQLLGEGLAALNSNGWIRLDPTSEFVGGLFQIFNENLNFLDGTILGGSAVSDFVFTEIETRGRNLIILINRTMKDAAVKIDLMSGNGSMRSSRSRIIKGNGVLTADLFRDLFKEAIPDESQYVRVKSTQPLQPVQIFQQESEDIALLAGQDAAAWKLSLYCPQYAQGGNYRTGISVINLDSTDGEVTFRLVGKDGRPMGEPRTLDIKPNGKIGINDSSFFNTPPEGEMTSGYVAISSNGVRLAGSTVFGDAKRISFYSALPLVSDLSTSMVFGHLVLSEEYYTGLAILNPGNATAAVAIELFAADGTLRDIKHLAIEAGRRDAPLLTQIFPELIGSTQSSGYLRVTSNMPIAAYVLYGTNSLSILSAIPAQ